MSNRRRMAGLLTVMSITVLTHAVAAASQVPVLTASVKAPPVLSFTGEERVSKPAVYEIDVPLGPSGEIRAQVGQPFVIRASNGLDLSGIVESLDISDSGYHVRLTSAISRLKYRVSNRTFLDMRVSDIVARILGDAGIGNVEFRLARSYPVRPVTIQYGENDLEFMSRLLEGAGIHYHFRGETVVFSDENSSFPSLGAPLRLAAQASPAVQSFRRGQSLFSGQVQTNDYAWKTPRQNLAASAQSPAFANLVENRAPAGASNPAESREEAKLRLEANVAVAQRCQGESTYPQLRAGYRFTLAGSSRPQFNQEYVVTGVRHQQGKEGYRNSFTCVPMEVPYRDSRSTPAPVIGGIVPGIVVGRAGETKTVNEYGQVRVRFPWRTVSSGSPETGDAGWVRVLQVAAGAGTAALWLPDAGDEVAVAFEHGDPDRPVVIGGFFNGVDVPPVLLPAGKNQSLFRAVSPTGKGAEIVFDSTPNDERLILRSGSNEIRLDRNGISSSSAIVPAASQPRPAPPPLRR